MFYLILGHHETIGLTHSRISHPPKIEHQNQIVVNRDGTVVKYVGRCRFLRGCTHHDDWLIHNAYNPVADDAQHYQTSYRGKIVSPQHTYALYSTLATLEVAGNSAIPYNFHCGILLLYLISANVYLPPNHQPDL